MSYLDRFVAFRCAPALLRLGVFPNAKEITESMAVLWAVDTHLGAKPCGLRFNYRRVTCVVVGDGAAPRTACLACFRTKWGRVVAVDPALRCAPEGDTERYAAVSRLELHAARIQDVRVDVDPAHEHVVVVLPHAHVIPNQALASLAFRAGGAGGRRRCTLSVIQMPCCNFEWHDRVCGLAPDAEYCDVAVASRRRRMRVWRDVMEAALRLRAVTVLRADGSGAVARAARPARLLRHPHSCSADRRQRSSGKEQVVLDSRVIDHKTHTTRPMR